MLAVYQNVMYDVFVVGIDSLCVYVSSKEHMSELSLARPT